MKNILFVISTLCLLIIASCGNNKKKESEVANNLIIDTVWNEKVQDTFYDLKLGDSIDENTIVSTLEKYGFLFMRKNSSAQEMFFKSWQSDRFTFGGLDWHMLCIGRNNGILTGIDFWTSCKDKTTSLAVYDGVKNAIETKYSPMLITSKDARTYAQTQYVGRNNIGAIVSCFWYESIQREILIGTRLSYYILNVPKMPSDEL